MTIKQDHPPEGYVFTSARLSTLQTLKIPFKEVVTDWQRGGRGHWNPVIRRAIPIAEEQRVDIVEAYYDRLRADREQRHAVATTRLVLAKQREIRASYDYHLAMIERRRAAGLSTHKHRHIIKLLLRAYPELKNQTVQNK